MLLGIDTNHERRNINQLLPNADVTLPDEATSVMDRLGQSQLDHLSLETALQKVLDLQRKHVIEGLSRFVEESETSQTAEKRGTLEHATRVLFVERKELTSSGSDLGENKLHAPDLTLVSKAVLAGELELGIEAFLLERTTRSTVCFRGCCSMTQFAAEQ